MRHILLTALLVVPAMLQAQQIIHGEMLGRPTDTGITIQAFFDADAEARLRYGVEEQQLYDSTAWQACAASSPLEIVLTELKPNQRYYYRLEYRSMIESTVVSRPVRTFHTQRPKGAPFTFVIQADPHMDNQSDSVVWQNCLSNQLNDQPDFMVDLGDVIMTDKLRDADRKYRRDTINWRARYMRRFYEKTCHSVPLFFTIGNHEGENGWVNDGTDNNYAVWSTLERKTYFLNPVPNDFYTGDTTSYPFVGKRQAYYAWEWGDAQFIVLDPYWHTKPKPDSLNGWRWTLGRQQYEWLKATLEQSTSPFKFVFCHQLVGGDPDGRGGVEFANMYEWGGANLDGTPGFAREREGWYKPVKDLLKEHKVTIFFHGHDHFFAKQEKDCLVYQETPQPSHSNFSNAGQADDYGYREGLILPNSGHLRVQVSPSNVKVEYVRAYNPANETATRKNGDVSATYAINRGNCYDSIASSVPILWNTEYLNEHVYPNPTAADARIAVNLAEAGIINAEIRATDGQLVRRLLQDIQVDAGRYTIMWDGRDDRALLAPSGSYIVIVRKGERVLTNEVLVRIR